MSRKTLMAVLGIIVAALTFLKGQFDLARDPTIVLGLAAVVLYILFEAKLDLKKLGMQPDKWKDPKFWLALFAVIIAAVNQELGLNLPGEAIVSVLTIIMTVLFGVKFKAAA